MDNVMQKSMEEKMKLINVVEEMVWIKIDEIIKTMDMCECSKCRLNACAIALNSLKPVYIITENDAKDADGYTENPEFQVKVIQEVTRALEIVKECPLH
ncbi:MAG: late competence development ComFB family protein [Clostridiales bacterium]|nr:late competence development ComFB family protein [Clostridiales bacterium]